MTALPIEGYAKEYTDAAQLLADIAARKRRLFPKLTLVSRESVRLTIAKEPPSLEAESSIEGAVDIPNFLALRPKPTEWLGLAPDAAFRQSESSIILRLVSEHTGISIRDLKSECRTKLVVRPRMIACWLMRNCTTLSLPVIGKRLGGRDHTTVLHSVKVIDALRAESAEVMELTSLLAQKVKEALAIGRKDEGQQ